MQPLTLDTTTGSLPHAVASDEEINSWPSIRGTDGQNAAPTVDWIVRGVLASNNVTLLWGAKKLGKSTFITALIKALEDGVPFLDLATEKTKAVWMTELPTEAHAQQAAKFGIRGHHKLFTRREARTQSWYESVDEGVRRAHATGAGLLIIDTYSRWAALDEGQENDSSTITKHLDYVQNAAEGLAVLVVHHAGHGNARHPRGASGFEAAVNISLRLQRGAQTNARIITCDEGTHYAGVTPSRLAYALDDISVPQRLVLLNHTNNSTATNTRSRRTLAAVPPYTTRDRVWAILPSVSPGCTARDLSREYESKWGRNIHTPTLYRYLKSFASSLETSGVPRSGKLRYWRKEESLAA
jgi:hypothetical protein